MTLRLVRDGDSLRLRDLPPPRRIVVGWDLSCEGCGARVVATRGDAYAAALVALRRLCRCRFGPSFHAASGSES